MRLAVMVSSLGCLKLILEEYVWRGQPKDTLLYMDHHTTYKKQKSSFYHLRPRLDDRFLHSSFLESV
jgi:hypothetical protein